LFYIKLEKDESLVITAKEPIYRGENLNKKIIYLIPKMIDDIDVTTSRVYLNYIRSDGIPNVIKLENTGAMYNDNYCQYTVPVDRKITNVAGDICTWLHFIPHSSEQIVVKSGECTLTIQDSKDFADYDDAAFPDLQDRVTFAEDNIEELKNDSHNHANMDELAKILSGDVDKWNGILVNMPEDGKDGVSVVSAVINENNELVLTYSNGVENNLGVIVGANGKDGKDGNTPVINIDESSEQWMVSYDNGKTWKSLGVDAVGNDYVLTETDKRDIAEQAAGLLDEKLIASIGTGVLQ